MHYGDLELHALPEGRFTVGLDKRFVPHTDGAPLPPGTLFVSVCPHVVRHKLVKDIIEAYEKAS